VKSATVVDLENDRLLVEYDPTRVAPPEMLKAVAAEGFRATVVADPPPEP
jgi:hypothetical protein